MARPRTHILKLSDSDREQLETHVRSRKGAHGLVRRARIILLSADGVPGSHIAEELHLTSATVLHWRKRYLKFGLFLAFLEHIQESVPEAMDLHLVLDNYSTHKHPKVRAWLAERPRFHLHFTPTYSSWLNQVERWFGLITQKAIRRGSFQSVRELVRRIDLFLKTYNKDAAPFTWTATAESILRKIERLCLKISKRNLQGSTLEGRSRKVRKEST